MPPAPVHVMAVMAAQPKALPAAAQAARAALAKARGDARSVAVPLLAHSVDGDGLAQVRAAMVERSMRDARSDADGLGIKGASDELLRELLEAAMRAIDRRFAPGTRRLDKSYWKFWVHHCDMLGTPPLRTNTAANTGADTVLHRREVAIALSALMAYVADNPNCLVSSMMARLRGVARRHKAVGLTFVSLTLAVMAADGLVQEHIDVHGADALQPQSKEPLLAAEIIGVLGLAPGTDVAGVTVGHNVEWQGVRVLVALLATMGCRKEAVALGQGEVPGPRKIMMKAVVYRFDGLISTHPSRAQLVAALNGAHTLVMVYVIPPPCKNDPTGTKFGNSPVPSRYHPSRPINLAREMLRYELMRSTEGLDRATAPMVLGPSGKMWTKPQLDKFFKALFAHVTEPARLARLTVHSFRVYLACALLAAGATPEQVMQLLRW